jgi:hypothetical protein
MRKEPEIRRVVLRGYFNLAVIVVGVALLLLPLVLNHGSMRGVQISMIAEAVCAIGLALWQRFGSGEWTTLFSGTVLVGAFLLLLLANATILTNNFFKGILSLLVLGILWVVLPRIAEYEGKHPTRSQRP